MVIHCKHNYTDTGRVVTIIVQAGEAPLPAQPPALLPHRDQVHPGGRRLQLPGGRAQAPGFQVSRNIFKLLSNYFLGRSAVHDIRRFQYVAAILRHLVVPVRFYQLSGASQVFILRSGGRDTQLGNITH